jgi:hypothetical protein
MTAHDRASLARRRARLIRDNHHLRCGNAAAHDWPAFTEAMHLLGRAAGWRAQQALWRLVSREDL